MEQQKIGFLGGSLGAIIGGLSWFMVLGFVIHSALLVILPVIFGVFCAVVVVKMCNTYPKSYFSITGLLLLAIVIFNLTVGNIFYGHISSSVWGTFTRLKFNAFWAAISLMGFYFVAREIYGGKK